jgi:putative aminopeptidase FrvX
MTTDDGSRCTWPAMAWLLLLVVPFLVTVAGASPPAAAAEPTLQDLVARLVSIPGVAGYEEAVREEIAARLPSWVEAETDSLGNLVTTIGSGAPHTVLVAPLDERGYVISDITDEGYLRLYRGTGAEYPLFDQYHYGQPMMIQAASGDRVAAVSATVSTHLAGDGPAADRARIRGIDDLWIDLGADSRAQVEALGVRDLDPVGLRDRAVALANGRVAGPQAQGRAAAAALQALLAGLEGPDAVQGTVTLAWVTQSTFRDLGLRHLAQRLQPDRAFLFTTASLRPPRDSDAGQSLTDQATGGSGLLGHGPLVVAGDAAVADAASAAGVAVQELPVAQVGRSFNLGALGWEDVEHHLIAMPVRYAQTPVEMVDSADVAAATALLLAAVGAPQDPRELITASQVKPRPASELVDAVAGAQPIVDGSFIALQQLIETYGVAGREEEVRDLILGMLPGWAESDVDAEGNITISAGTGDRHLLFIAHQDEIGYEVTGIDADGRLRLRMRGGGIDGLYEAHPALIHTSAGALPAILTPRPGYGEAEEFSPRTLRASLAVDLGTGSAEETEALGVAVGDVVTVVKRFQPLAGSRATARSVDDRVGCAAMILALQRIDPEALQDRRVTFAFSIEEETGLVGASTIAARSEFDVVFSVDTFVSSASPVDWQRRARVPLGSGPVLKVMDGNHVTPRSAVDRLLEVAGPHAIPVSLSITGGGTDAGAFVTYGSVPVPIGWPSRYSHSPVELMDQVDLDQLVDLILALSYEY